MSAIHRLATSQAPPATVEASPLVYAIAVGLIVTNVFAPQTLVEPIAATLGLGPWTMSLAATATLLGYAFGLFLLVPLADIAENRALVTRMLSVAALASAAAALAPGAGILLAALLVLGAACSAIQVLVPIVAAMAPPERRGRMIGDVMGGLMVGILLARPIASLTAGFWGWRSFYGLSAVVLLTLALVLAARLPRRRPAGRDGYLALVASLGPLLRKQPVLRRHAVTAALVMAAFSLVWTAIGIRLAEPPFGLGQKGIALFALAGAGGALATPLFGRLGDCGLTGRGLVAADLILIASVGLLAWAGSALTDTPLAALAALAVGAFFLDAGVTGDQTLGRRAINLLPPETRGRINGLFVGIFFLGGSIGSALAGPVIVWGGWGAICTLAAMFGAAALVKNAFGRQPET